ncbi:MAG TPA: HTH-type transcriptional regulator CysB, partial [Pseudomonadales bacterium]|nr:HTH-type transcriptional regulator CysB [Pseudomonadales bacterium]
GIGIIAQMAYDSLQDEGLVALDATHLFDSSTTMIGCRRGTFLRGYMYEFIEIFAPHLDRDVVEHAFTMGNRAELDELFKDVELPTR